MRKAEKPKPDLKGLIGAITLSLIVMLLGTYILSNRISPEDFAVRMTTPPRITLAEYGVAFLLFIIVSAAFLGYKILKTKDSRTPGAILIIISYCVSVLGVLIIHNWLKHYMLLFLNYALLLTQTIYVINYSDRCYNRKDFWGSILSVTLSSLVAVAGTLYLTHFISEIDMESYGLAIEYLSPGLTKTNGLILAIFCFATLGFIFIKRNFNIIGFIVANGWSLLLNYFVTLFLDEAVIIQYNYPFILTGFIVVFLIVVMVLCAFDKSPGGEGAGAHRF